MFCTGGARLAEGAVAAWLVVVADDPEGLAVAETVVAPGGGIVGPGFSGGLMSNVGVGGGTVVGEGVGVVALAVGDADVGFVVGFVLGFFVADGVALETTGVGAT